MADENKEAPPRLSRRRAACLKEAQRLVGASPHVILFPDGLAGFADALAATIRKNHSVGKSLGISPEYDLNFLRKQVELSKKGARFRLNKEPWRTDPKILSFFVYLKLAENRVCHPFEVHKLLGRKVILRDEYGREWVE